MLADGAERFDLLPADITYRDLERLQADLAFAVWQACRSVYQEQRFDCGLLGRLEVGEQGITPAGAWGTFASRSPTGNARVAQLLEQPVEGVVHQVNERVGVREGGTHAFRTQQLFPSRPERGAVLREGA